MVNDFETDLVMPKESVELAFMVCSPVDKAAVLLYDHSPLELDRT